MRLLLLKLPYCPHPEAVGCDLRARGTFRPMPSLALASLAGWIERWKTHDIQVQAQDVNLAAYTMPGQPADTGLLPGALEAAVRDHEYDVLGLSVPFVFNIRWLRDAVKLSHKFHPEAGIIAGGGLPTLMPKHCLEAGVDRVVVGEGEELFLAALEAVGDTTRIIASKCRTHMSLLALPAWNLLDVNSCFDRSGERLLPIETSRGCPHNCSFCTVTSVWGPSVRYKPAGHVVGEIDSLISKYDIEKLWFVDDNMTFKRDWAVLFLNMLADAKFPVSIDASNFSVKHLDEELIDLLAKAGFTRISVAIESGSPVIQQQVNKRLDLEQAVRVTSMIKKRGLAVHLCWMVGFPGETVDQLQETYALVRRLRAESNQFCAVVPFPGTRLHADAQAAGFLPPDDGNLDKYSCSGAELLQNQEWTYDQLRSMTYDVNIDVNFLNNPQLETESGRAKFLMYLEALLLRLPDHVIALVLAGYLRGLASDQELRARHYATAIQALKDPSVAATFGKYIKSGHPALDDFLVR